jgi:hypothetical protein
MSAYRIIIVAAATLVAATVRAHHSFAAEFLEDQTGTIEGTVTEVWFKNPHVRYYVKTTNEAGESEVWDIRSSSPTILVRRGWTPETIKEGDHIKVHGHLGRDGRKLLSVITIELADGTVLGQAY